MVVERVPFDPKLSTLGPDDKTTPAAPKFKLVWKVGTVPTGRYRSFQHRNWPQAFYDGDEGRLAVYITCEDAYRPAVVKTGQHKPLEVWVYDYSACKDSLQRERRTRKMNRKFTTLAEVKTVMNKFLSEHSELWPKEETR